MSKYDVIVLGSGPGGYVTAIRASQLGFKTAVIEKESLGGVCLNWGCIPTKALLKSAQVFNYLKHAEDYGLKVKSYDKDFNAVVNRSRNVADGMSKGVNFLMKKNKIDIISGYGKIKPGKKVDVDGNEYSADHIIIATGARSRELPNLKQDNDKVIGYRKAMTLQNQPKKLIIVGSGAIGVEFAYFYNSMGTDVTIVEYMPRIVPVEDEDVSKQLERSFKKNGMKIMTSTEVTSVDTTGKGVKATIKTNKGEKVIEADIVLSAVGIKTNIENIGLEEVGIVTDKDKILVNDFYQTNMPGYYAIGDVTSGPALAHVASAEGILCVEKIAEILSTYAIVILLLWVANITMIHNIFILKFFFICLFTRGLRFFLVSFLTNVFGKKFGEFIERKGALWFSISGILILVIAVIFYLIFT